MEEILKIICPFCNAPYTAKMEEELYAGGGWCDTCDIGTEISGEIRIICEKCKRVWPFFMVKFSNILNADG